jgi:Na+/H+ antiporter NhaD/arsenite permease-like protein
MNHGIVESMPLWMSIPFVVMLLFIAVGPLLFNHWWEENRNKLIVSLLLGIPVSIVLIYRGLHHELMHQILFDYIPFIILLGALFIITGGIHLKGDIEAKPLTNTVFLAIGAVLASVMGTTGQPCCLSDPLSEQIRNVSLKSTPFFFLLPLWPMQAEC